MSEETIFETALSKTAPAERAAYLEVACAGEPELRRRVEALLQAHQQSGGLLDTPLRNPTPPTETAAEPAKPEPPVPAPKPVEPQLLATNNPADMKVDLNDRPPETPPAAEKPTQDTAKPQDKQANVSGKPSTGRKLTQARKIFSRSKTSDPIARLAMAMVSRDERFDRLCGTELVAQLKHGSPAYNPVLFPRVVRPQGNVFDLPNGSFRDAQGWRELSFKCEVDSEAMKVVSFAFSVGKPIPKSEWQSRGFPEY